MHAFHPCENKSRKSREAHVRTCKGVDLGFLGVTPFITSGKDPGLSYMCMI
jgi:hypothetical protein